MHDFFRALGIGGFFFGPLKRLSKKKKTKPKKDSRVAIIKALIAGEQKQIAKAGMVGSLGGLVVTGFFRFRGARMLHPWLAWTFLGFSLWHYLISKPSIK